MSTCSGFFSAQPKAHLPTSSVHNAISSSLHHGHLKMEKLAAFLLLFTTRLTPSNHRKTLLPLNTIPNQHLPAVTVAAYAMLWTSALQEISKGAKLQSLQPPKWRKDRASEGKLPSTGDLLRLLRYEIWAGALRPGTFYHFVNDTPSNTNAQKPTPDLPAILFAAA